MRQINDRLKYNLDILELQLFPKDLEGNMKHLRNCIELIQRKGVRVILHQPMFTPYGEFVHIINNNKGQADVYDHDLFKLNMLMKEYKINCVIHGNYSGDDFLRIDSKFNLYVIEPNPKDVDKMKLKMAKIQEESNNQFYFENSIIGLYHFGNFEYPYEIIQELNLATCLDVSHLMASVQGDMGKFMREFNRLHRYVEYYHLVDSAGYRITHDSLTIGEGCIDWRKVVNKIKNKPAIYEIGLKNFNDCKEMIDSYINLMDIKDDIE